MLGAFSDDDVTHVEGDVNPLRDMEIIHDELRLKDEEFLKKYLEGMEATCKRAGKNLDKNKAVELETVRKVCKLVAEDKKDVRLGDWNNKEVCTFYLTMHNSRIGLFRVFRRSFMFHPSSFAIV
jgi:obg-like ATPase 1